ncbi:hypothetical protein Tco_1329037 [Tanacetum coccineum]
MPYPRFNKIIINHFLKQYKSLTNLNHKHYHTIKDDGILSRLKFVRICEDYQEYGHLIPDVILTDLIKHSDAYQMFIKYSTNQIPPKKSKGKGSKGKKTADESQETVDVSEESELEPKPAKKKTASRRVVKKKVTLSVDDNIIFDDPDAALELAKSINHTKTEEAEEARKVLAKIEPKPAKKKTASRRVGKKKVQHVCNTTSIFDDPDAALEFFFLAKKSISHTKTEEAEEVRKVHATHARIVTKSVFESAKKNSSGRSSKSVVIQDTSSAPKSKPATSKASFKVPYNLLPVEQEAANIMQDLKESKKTSRRLPGTRGSNEGTGTIPGAPDESGVPDEEKDITEEKKDEKDGDADDEGNDHVSDTQDADDEDVQIESGEDDIYKYKIRVRKDEDEEMKDAEVEGFDKGDEEITDAAQEEAEKTSEAKDDTKKIELHPSSSSLSVSLGFSDQFLKLSVGRNITLRYLIYTFSSCFGDDKHVTYNT